MFSNLTLYYLNQIGIKPWITKEPSPGYMNSLPLLHTPKIVICISDNLGEKAQLLFNRLISFINLPGDDLLIIPVNEKASVDHIRSVLESQLENKHVVAALLFGNNPVLSELHIASPVIRTLSPEYLLDYPNFKRKVFQDLSSLNCLIA